MWVIWIQIFMRSWVPLWCWASHSAVTTYSAPVLHLWNMTRSSLFWVSIYCSSLRNCLKQGLAMDICSIYQNELWGLFSSQSACLNPFNTGLYRAVTLKQGIIKADLTVGKSKSGYVNGWRYWVNVQQEGRCVLHAFFSNLSIKLLWRHFWFSCRKDSQESCWSFTF